MAAELIDRFGKLPQEVENLLEIVAVKVSCRVANIEKIDAGPKGAVIAFRHNNFPNPPVLIQYINKQVGTVKVRPDQKLVIVRGWEVVETRVKGIKRLAAELAEMALGGN
jgi:transcription-repair coupling factor (superfamily II helicase)